jgi:hypothetical protein
VDGRSRTPHRLDEWFGTERAGKQDDFSAAKRFHSLANSPDRMYAALEHCVGVYFLDDVVVAQAKRGIIACLVYIGEGQIEGALTRRGAHVTPEIRIYDHIDGRIVCPESRLHSFRG